MSEKRRDHKGRILKTGESQRKDLLYQYRYTDLNNKRKTIYDSDLKKLREKEKIIQRHLEDGVSYSDGKMRVIDLVRKYIDLRKFVKESTKACYIMVINLLSVDEFGSKAINEIKMFDAKEWVIKLNSEGRKFSTVNSICGIIRPAFQMAVDECLLYRNPFAFKLSDVLRNDASVRVALKQHEQHMLINFFRNDKIYKKYYDEIVVLLETGMRISELCGLTIDDLDFENKRIRVDHQLLRKSDGVYYIETPKTEKGKRFIPMTQAAYMSFKNILSKRPKLNRDFSVDGYHGFVCLDKNNRPKVALHYGNMMRFAMKRYKELHSNHPLPHITPHVLRHTFCTNMAQSGMDVKALQYIMGHSDIQITLNTYTHSNYEFAAEQINKFSNIIDITALFQNQKLG